MTGSDVEVSHSSVQLGIRNVHGGKVSQPGRLLLLLLSLLLGRFVVVGWGFVEVDGDGAVGLWRLWQGRLLGVHLDRILVEFAGFCAEGGLLGSHFLGHLVEGKQL